MIINNLKNQYKTIMFVLNYYIIYVYTLCDMFIHVKQIIHITRKNHILFCHKSLVSVLFCYNI